MIEHTFDDVSEDYRPRRVPHALPSPVVSPAGGPANRLVEGWSAA
jgi:hypothetical protein